MTISNQVDQVAAQPFESSDDFDQVGRLDQVDQVVDPVNGPGVQEQVDQVDQAADTLSGPGCRIW